MSHPEFSGNYEEDETESHNGENNGEPASSTGGIAYSTLRKG